MSEVKKTVKKPARKPMNMTFYDKVRYATNTIAFALLNLNVFGFSMRGLCAPGFVCHGCPWATFCCPVGAVAYGFSLKTFPYFALGFVLALGLIFARLICAYICPFGFFQDLLYRIPVPKFKLPRFMRYGKYIFLLLLVIGFPVMLSSQSKEPYVSISFTPAKNIDNPAMMLLTDIEITNLSDVPVNGITLSLEFSDDKGPLAGFETVTDYFPDVHIAPHEKARFPAIECQSVFPVTGGRVMITSPYFRPVPGVPHELYFCEWCVVGELTAAMPGKVARAFGVDTPVSQLITWPLLDYRYPNTSLVPAAAEEESAAAAEDEAPPAEEEFFEDETPAEDEIIEDEIIEDEEIIEDDIPADEELTEEDSAAEDEMIEADSAVADGEIIEEEPPAEETLTEEDLTAEELGEEEPAPAEEEPAVEHENVGTDAEVCLMPPAYSTEVEHENAGTDEEVCLMPPAYSTGGEHENVGTDEEVCLMPPAEKVTSSLIINFGKNNPVPSASKPFLTWRFALLALFLALMIFTSRPFCKTMCPLGAMFALMTPFSIMRMKVDHNACVNCGLCDKVCPMDLDVRKEAGSMECIYCGNCVKKCPKKCITRQVLKK